MVTFKKPIGSVSVSGHKFVGAPVPCGVVITRKEYVEALSSDVEYLNSRDATIMGSRNGHAPLYLWYTLTKKGYEGMRKDVEKCLRNAHLLKVRQACVLSTEARLCFVKLIANGNLMDASLIFDAANVSPCPVECDAWLANAFCIPTYRKCARLHEAHDCCRQCWRRLASRQC